MAGHALTPATRRCLGGPLPRQQADGPRDHPGPAGLFSSRHAVGGDYPVLAAVSRRYPGARGRFLTCYSPVRRSVPRGYPLDRSLDLHVLSAPPAFVLSQDQTLRRELTARRSVRGRPRSSSEESRATGLPPGPRLRPNAAEKVSTAVVFGFSFCRYYQTHEPKFVELGSRSIGFLLRTRCLVLKEHPPHCSANPAGPTPT